MKRHLMLVAAALFMFAAVPASALTRGTTATDPQVHQIHMQ